MNPPQDNVNAVLSFLYTLIFYRVDAALEGAGLDPYVGYLHKLNYGKQALAFDLVEEFRVQKSVFEIEATAVVVARLRQSVRRIIADEDFVVYFDLCGRCWQKKMKYGPGKFCDIDEKEFYLI